MTGLVATFHDKSITVGGYDGVVTRINSKFHFRKDNFTAIAAPLVTDDSSVGYEVGSKWYYGTTIYECLSASVGAANWSQINAVMLPAGTGTEIQCRSSATAFGAVDGSSWNGTTLSLPQSLVASNLYIGNALTSATPTAGYLKATSGSGTNVAGANLYLDAGQPTGSATGGSVIIRTAPAGTSGTEFAALVDTLTISNTRIYATKTLQVASGSGESIIESYGSGSRWIADNGIYINGYNGGLYLTANAGRYVMVQSVHFGVNTTAPDKQVEINSATGNCLRLTYNDANGSATYYTDFAVSSAGNLTITPSGGLFTIVADVDAGSHTVYFGTADQVHVPTGTTQTIDLGNGNHQTLDTSSASGDLTVTLTVPPGSCSGSLIIKQTTTARNFIWVASSGSIVWLGTTRPGVADANKYRLLAFRWDGAILFLSVTETN